MVPRITQYKILPRTLTNSESYAGFRRRCLRKKGPETAFLAAFLARPAPHFAGNVPLKPPEAPQNRWGPSLNFARGSASLAWVLEAPFGLQPAICRGWSVLSGPLRAGFGVGNVGVWRGPRPPNPPQPPKTLGESSGGVGWGVWRVFGGHRVVPRLFSPGNPTRPHAHPFWPRAHPG